MIAVATVPGLPAPPSTIVDRPGRGRRAGVWPALVLTGQLLCGQLLLLPSSHAADSVESAAPIESITQADQSEPIENNQSSDCQDNCVATGEWEFGLALGFGYSPNPLADGEDIHLPVLPHFSYYGERFFIESGSVGYTLAESDSQRLNLLVRPNLDYFYFAGSGTFYSVLTHPFRYGVAGELSERELTYLGGMEYSWFHGPWQV